MVLLESVGLRLFIRLLALFVTGCQLCTLRIAAVYLIPSSAICSPLAAKVVPFHRQAVHATWRVRHRSINARATPALTRVDAAIVCRNPRPLSSPRTRRFRNFATSHGARVCCVYAGRPGFCSSRKTPLRPTPSVRVARASSRDATVCL